MGKDRVQPTHTDGGDTAVRDVAAADQVRDDGVQLAELGVLVLDGGPGALVQRHQHEHLRHVQAQQLLLLQTTNMVVPL